MGGFEVLACHSPPPRGPAVHAGSLNTCLCTVQKGLVLLGGQYVLGLPVCQLVAQILPAR